MTAAATIPFIDEAAVRAALDARTLVDAMADALEAFSAGRAEQPVRSLCALGGDDAVMLTKPAVYGVAAVKVVTLVPDNAARGLPTHQALVLAFDRETGAPLAVIEGASITEIRTAAASAAAARALLTAPPRRIGVIGSGVQARSHVRVFRDIFGPAQTRLWSPNASNAKAAADALGVDVATDAETACEDADVVIAATACAEPAIRDAWVAEGALVVSVGAPLRQWRELDDALIARQLVVDSREAVEQESGDVVATGAPVLCEIGDVIGGRAAVDPMRTRVFKSAGLAVEDAAAARLVLEATGRLRPRD